MCASLELQQTAHASPANLSITDGCVTSRYYQPLAVQSCDATKPLHTRKVVLRNTCLPMDNTRTVTQSRVLLVFALVRPHGAIHQFNTAANTAGRLQVCLFTDRIKRARHRTLRQAAEGIPPRRQLAGAAEGSRAAHAQEGGYG